MKTVYLSPATAMLLEELVGRMIVCDVRSRQNAEEVLVAMLLCQHAEKVMSPEQIVRVMNPGRK